MTTTTTSTTTTTTEPFKYWIVSDITRSIKTKAYTTTGIQVSVEITNGYGTITSLDASGFSEESLSSIISRFQIKYISNELINRPSFSTTSTLITTTMYKTLVNYTVNNDYLPLIPNQVSSVITINEYNKSNFFTNSSSLRKYVTTFKSNKIFTPEKFYDGVFYPQEGKTLYVNFNNLYVGVLIEFEINVAALGESTTLKFYSDQKVTKNNEPITKREVGSILINKYSDSTILFKPISAYSSYLFARKNSIYYSQTSEMTGIVFDLQNLPKENVLIKYFVFNTVFSNLFTEISTKNKATSVKPKPSNTLKEMPQTTSTTTTTTSNSTSTTFFYDTSKYQKQLISVSTSPVHFTVTVYSQ